MCQHPNSSEPAKGQAQLSTVAQNLVPNHPVARAALELALSSLPASIFNHSFRVYLYAKAFLTPPTDGEIALPTSPVETGPLGLHVLFTACMLHDISVIEKYDSTPERFEVVSADEAARLLRTYQVDEESIREAWLAIALHSTPGIADRLPGIIKALRQAIMAEFGALAVPTVRIEEQDRDVISSDLPRLDIEKDLGQAVVRQALATRSKAPKLSWAGVMLRAKEENPDWEGVNKAFWN